jgi:uncharacterized protein
MSHSFSNRTFAPKLACPTMAFWFAFLIACLARNAVAAGESPPKPAGKLALDGIPRAQFQLGGLPGERVRANVERWLTVAPQNNPGLLDMFAQRDSGKTPDLMPWAGEFVGKYLISGVQALRMSDDPKLQTTLADVVRRLCDLQADDGYLGPWPKAERLRGQWDLWGHYHIILGLRMWSEHTGDPRAAATAQKMADLVCNTFLDTGLRVFDAGSHEMNMAIIHALGELYRETGNERYLRMAREVLKDFERAGDYYRTGLAGREFFRSPRPRWESLHSLQGLVELYRITGDPTYRDAFLHHWASIRRFDMRSTGGFSSGEQATGNPFRNDAIETCCVIAWQAVCLDALRLTGDATIADDLELATFNAALGAQHPSGAWCTYDTPLNGNRQPSHIQIAFQIRPGTPHLNCCSVNGPRGYGIISEWGVMRSDAGLALNYLGEMQAGVQLADGTPVALRVETDYPASGSVRIVVEPAQPREFVLAVRIPDWSSNTSVTVAGQPISNVPPGRYLQLARKWTPGDEIQLQLNMDVRYEAGDLEQAGRAALYRGPILLAADSRFAPETSAVIDVSKLGESQSIALDAPGEKAAGPLRPWLAVDVPTVDGQKLRLIDFASAGAATIEGQPLSTYRSWLPAQGLRPPRPVAVRPADKTQCGAGPIRFLWRASTIPPGEQRRYTVLIAATPDFDPVVVRYDGPAGSSLVVPAESLAKLQPKTPYYWKLVATNGHGQSESMAPFKQFTIDPSLPPLPDAMVGRASDGLFAGAALQGDVRVEYGRLAEARGWKPCAGPRGNPGGAVELDGQQGMIKFAIEEFPERDYTVSIWVRVTEFPGPRLGQIFSAWSRGMDDPLRLVVQGDQLFARLEAGQFYGTKGWKLQTGIWYHVAAVKQADQLTLYVDGVARATAAVPSVVASAAENFALGGNPHYVGGPEFLAAQLSDLRFYVRALTADQVQALFQAGAPTTTP